MDYISLSGIVLMLSLGLRHGLDPDHIAAIDGMTFRSIHARPRMAQWTGTLFALGHGLVVTVIAVGVALLGQQVAMPEALLNHAGWIPTMLLILIGTLNLRALLANGRYETVGWKTRLLPPRLREATHPGAVVLVGVFFAIVFDTATQAAAWGYAATTTGGVVHALLVGVVFTLGMVITDTIDGRIMCKACGNGASQAQKQEYRRAVGWLIVAMSFGVAGYNIASRFFPQVEVSDAAYTGIGLVFLLALPVIYLLFGNRDASSRSVTRFR